MNFENVYEKIGSFGYQQRLYFVQLGLREMYLAGPIMHIVLACVKPGNFQCVLDNGTIYRDSCPSNDVRQCKNVIYQAESSSIITEWNLICSESYKVQLSQSIYMSGILFGAILFGYASDAIGRLKTYVFTISCCVFFATLSSFSSSYWIYVIMRFLTGFSIQGAALSGYVLLIEYIGSSTRGLVSTACGFFFTAGTLLISSLAYLIRDWRMLTLVSSIWGAPFVLQYFLLPESPRWLFTNGYRSEAKSVINRIAKGNGKCELTSDDFCPDESDHSKLNKKYDSLQQFFTNCYLFKLIIIQSYSWFVTSSMYYGLTLTAGELGSNIYTSFFLLSLCDIPAALVPFMLIDRIGRRRLLCGFMFLGGVACLVIQLLPSDQNMHLTRTIAALTGKFCASGQFGVIYIYSAEIIPTSVRNGVMGVLAVAARVGGIICPFIILLGQYVSDLHFTILGVFAFTAGIFNLWLPETNKKQLPDTIDNLLNSYLYNVKELNVVDSFNNDDDFIVCKDTEPMLTD
ncbi:slc22a6 (predicted) [Pycnogonum litorale]